MFAGVCMGNGCNRGIAARVAKELERDGVKVTTLTCSVSFDAVSYGAESCGVTVEPIEPHCPDMRRRLRL
jgi:hypothetical protein